MGAGFFPLDEELGLDSSGLTPHAHECLVRLGAWMPFAQAIELLAALLGVQVSAATARRLCLQAGQAAEAVQQEQAQPTGSTRFPVPQEEPAERLVMSCDGALVPLRQGRWAEVKMLVIGQLDSPRSSPEESPTAHTSAHSYFARLTDAATFADQASVEITRRGIERARDVAAVHDGAEWLPPFVDGHRHDAVRILDFAHAVGYLAAIADQAQQTGTRLPARWLEVLRHHLKQEGPERVLAHLQRLGQRRPLSAIAEAVRYFSKRLSQMQYPLFQAEGWPIGSGMVESANKVVMQARLKGAGMHWEEHNVNPMLALRCAISSDRWEETWPQQERYQHDARQFRRQQRVAQRRAARQQRLRLLILRLWLFRPRNSQQPTASTRKGRTPGQQRWGRQTFSPRAIREGRYAKI